MSADDIFSSMFSALSQSQGKIKVAQAKGVTTREGGTLRAYVCKLADMTYRVVLVWENITNEIREKACTIPPDIQAFIQRYGSQLDIHAKMWHPRHDYKVLEDLWNDPFFATHIYDEPFVSMEKAIARTPNKVAAAPSIIPIGSKKRRRIVYVKQKSNRTYRVLITHMGSLEDEERDCKDLTEIQSFIKQVGCTDVNIDAQIWKEQPKFNDSWYNSAENWLRWQEATQE